MSEPAPSSTTILGRLRLNPRVETAWRAFVRRYGQVIHTWCRQWRLQAPDAEEVTAQVFAKLWKTVGVSPAEHANGTAAAGRPADLFDPQRGIRGLLKVMARHALHQLLTERRRHGDLVGAADYARAELDQAEQDLEARLEREYRFELLEVAERRVRLQIEELTWHAYWLVCREGASAQETAARLNLSVNQVYVYKKRVLDRIGRETARLRADDDA